MTKKWLMLQWIGGNNYPIFPSIHYPANGSWKYIDPNQRDAIYVTRYGKPSRLCKPGDYLIIDIETGEYFDDLQYLPIYEQQ